MKKLIIVVLAAASIVNARAQQNIPDVVRSSFEKHFPNVKAKWEMENKDYEANFVDKGEKMSAIFDKAGNWKETESVIPFASLPSSARAWLSQTYKDKVFKSGERISKADGTVNYEVEVDHQDILFDSKGNRVKA